MYDLPDTLLYAVNFPDGGFSIMAADTHLNNSVLCVTESGNITVDDFVNGISFLRATEECETKLSEDCEGEEDFSDAGPQYLYSLLVSTALLDYADTLSLEVTPETRESASVSVGPLLTTKWGQMSPFNQIKSSPGCVVIAVAQIMAFNEKPATSKFSSVSASWSTLKTVCSYTEPSNIGSSYAQLQVAYLANELGNSNNCDVSADGNSNADKAKRTFKNYGYSNVTKRIGCENGDIKKINQQLTDDRTPVFMIGKRKDSDGQHGHAWVIDGQKNDMYHINWGWNGDCDGYYAKGVFNTSSRNSFDQIYDTGSAISTGRNYYHYFRTLFYSK